MSRLTLTEIVHGEDDSNVSECPQVEAVSHGHTVAQAATDLQEAMELYFDEHPLPQVTKLFKAAFGVGANRIASDVTCA